MKKIFAICLVFFVSGRQLVAQQADQLLRTIKSKLDQVTSYEADALMKTNVSFLKVPESAVKIYYKQPDKLKIKNQQGISLVPRGAMVLSLNGLLQGNFSTIDAGRDSIAGIPVRVLKLIPTDEHADWVISTIYIDEKRLLVLRAKTTTKDNGTYEVNMIFGKYIQFALPDKISCIFNTKDYKLPKGITFDYDDGTKKPESKLKSDSKGVIEIYYSKYLVNKKIPDSIF